MVILVKVKYGIIMLVFGEKKKLMSWVINSMISVYIVHVANYKMWMNMVIKFIFLRIAFLSLTIRSILSI